ncbi:TPM domain-containing protein [Methylocella sp.]|uniref:TPM domain-containing protein n=1 Tax=Methylocella sp. TaxID=1978226 RepID=UPI003784BBB9
MGEDRVRRNAAARAVHGERRRADRPAGEILSRRRHAGFSRAASAGAGALILLAAFFVSGLAFAYSFPALSGRVVDAANVIPADAKAAIAAKLAALEAKTGAQLVVATVPSLEGDEIEPYANALFRAWGLGSKDKNNGVLLLVAPKEKRVRVEVGYGLEGTLTDALSRIVIANAMAPRFKAGDFGGGIARGVDDLVAILTSDPTDWEKRPELRVDHDSAPVDDLAPFIVFGLFILIVFLMMRAPRRRDAGTSYDPRRGAPPGADPRRGQGGAGDLLTGILIGMTRPGRGRGGFDDWGGGGGFSGGGGFFGGGGSSGGGGASGSW